MIWRPDRKMNYTPFARHFHTAKPVVERFAVRTGEKRRAPGRRMLRLSFGAITPKEDRSILELHRMIAQGQLSARFLFPDTGFITTAMYPEFWTLGVGRNIVFPETTVAELSGWLNTPFHNAYLHCWLPRALKACLAKAASSERAFRTVDVLGTIGHTLAPFRVGVANKACLAHGYDYYVKLLSLRKLLGVVAHRECTGQLGRAPTESEFKQHLHKAHGPILAPIAFKGWQNHGKRNYLADEELVVTAVFTAIATGRETLILTRDTDVFEQFTKLLHLLTCDYESFRFAEVHHHDPNGCPMFPFAVPEGADSFGFEGNVIEHVVMPEPELDHLWPSSYTPVHTYCVLVGNTCVEPKISVAAFCLETEMGWMLNVKEETGGKNTQRYPGKNMIIGTLSKGERVGNLFVLGPEKCMNYQGVNVTWLDVQHALQPAPLITRKHYFRDY
jgi:hypothetical protein